jgi:RimJ/RimL family protein N-acetyltransferase
MEIIKINKSNINYLEEFLKNKIPDSFRYFNTRDINIINNHLVTLIGLVNNIPVAYGHIDQDQEKKYWLGVCVLEEYQKNKYGTKILEELIEVFYKSNEKLLNLTVDKENIIAQKLYLKYGFTILSENEKYYHMILNNNLLYLPVSYGEAIDKLTILDIKLHKITDNRRTEVKKEYDKLYYYLQEYITKCQFYYNILREINLSIWEKQDIFRYSSDINIKNSLCIDIIEENDRRFRIKNKINTSLNSLLKEQKGYKIKKAFLLSHLGLGDNITALPVARYLSTMYDEIIVVCKESTYENLKLLYSDDNTIKLLPVPNDQYINPLYNEINYKRETKDCDVYLMGYHNPKNALNLYDIGRYNPKNLPFNFYDDINMDYSIFWKYFYLPKLDQSDKLYEILIENNIKSYIFVHNIASSGVVFTYKNLDDDILIINPCNNHYSPEHKYYELAEKFVNKKLPEYMKIMSNADELYLADSSFFCLALGLDIKTNKCYIASRNNTDYSYIWTDKYKYKNNKRIFMNMK